MRLYALIDVHKFMALLYVLGTREQSTRLSQIFSCRKPCSILLSSGLLNHLLNVVSSGHISSKETWVQPGTNLLSVCVTDSDANKSKFCYSGQLGTAILIGFLDNHKTYWPSGNSTDAVLSLHRSVPIHLMLSKDFKGKFELHIVIICLYVIWALIRVAACVWLLLSR